MSRTLDATVISTQIMMTSSNGNIFRVTGPLCGEFTGPGEFPTQRQVTRSFDVFFDLRLNKRLSKQPWGWWFETPAWSLWRHRNVTKKTCVVTSYDSQIYCSNTTFVSLRLILSVARLFVQQPVTGRFSPWRHHDKGICWLSFQI